MDNDWEKLPMYIGYKDIMELGFKKDRIYKWFNREDFPPMIRSEGMRVNKYKFKDWLEKMEVARCDY